MIGADFKKINQQFNNVTHVIVIIYLSNIKLFTCIYIILINLNCQLIMCLINYHKIDN